MDLYDIAIARNLSGGVAGGGSAPLVVTLNTETQTLDKTWQEMYDVFPNVCVYIDDSADSGSIGRYGVRDVLISSVVGHPDVYIVEFYTGSDAPTMLGTYSADGYPTSDPSSGNGLDT